MLIEATIADGAPEPSATAMHCAGMGLVAESPITIKTLRQLATAEENCRRCPLYRDATQAVPGEGPQRAAFMLVGEQPGDKEDLAGKPFVGPAGRVLDQALQEAGIAREETFVSNAVKHFKHEMRGKPLKMADGTMLVVTVHPSSLLRIKDDDERHAAYRGFVVDLKAAAAAGHAPRRRRQAAAEAPHQLAGRDRVPKTAAGGGRQWRAAS